MFVVRLRNILTCEIFIVLFILVLLSVMEMDMEGNKKIIGFPHLEEAGKSVFQSVRFNVNKDGYVLVFIDCETIFDDVFFGFNHVL